ncbi:MAG: YihY family inner membrane protein [Anaerohalosphaera sp.]|nr:YihY family inner membrane protein [Anaerohalosphaera sp.]
MLTKIIDFLKTDIWRIRLTNYPPSKSFFLKQLRIILLAVRGFAEDKCKFRASALTFFTLLSIVPVIAMMFGVAKGFGLEERLRAEIMTKMGVQQGTAVEEQEESVVLVEGKTALDGQEGVAEEQQEDVAEEEQEIAAMEAQQEIAERVIKFAESLLAETSGGFIAGIGIVFLFWSIIKVLSNIEHSFNDIWGVKTHRSIGRKLSDYLSMMLICPFLLILAGSATVAISSNIKLLMLKVDFLNAFWPLISVLLKTIPYCTLWVAFTFVFIFMPNTRVRLRSALLAGIVTGTLVQLTQWGYVNFQIGVAKNSAIYGSFAALPLFLIWVQTSWFVVLFGAELSFAHQNVETYEFEQDCLSVSYSFKRLLSLLIAHKIVDNFCKGDEPLNAEEISHALEIPIRLVRQILFELVGAGVLIAIKKDETRETSYQPARDTDQLTIKYIVDALEHSGDESIPVTQSEQLNELKERLKQFSEAITNSPSNVVLKNI